MFLRWTPLKFLSLMTFTLSNHTKSYQLNFFKGIHIFREDIVDADIAVKNLVITNLSTFVTEIAHLELEDLSLELELAIPVLRVRIMIM